MTNGSGKLRRLLDLPGVSELEYRALLKREFAEPEARAAYPEIDACVVTLFGLTSDQAEATELPADCEDIATKPPAAQVAAFESQGWDVTDDKRRPLRVLGHFSGPLWLALNGVAGSLPFQAEAREDDAVASKLLAEARLFRKR